MRYTIKGDSTPVVICELEAGESMMTESGSMVWMSDNFDMKTSGGGLGKALGRMFSGENIFQNIYTAKGGPGMIAFATSFPGSIRAVRVTPDKPVIVQKSAFLCAEPGVELSLFFQNRMKAGLFSGEGFIMQKLSGNGMAFIEIDGHGEEYTLAPGQRIVIDTGNLAMMDASCSIDIRTVGGIKNTLFGGEGLFHTVVTGPGNVVVQSMTINALAGAIASVLPQNNQ